MNHWIFTILLLIFSHTVLSKTLKILNVSYDATRELYQQYNQAFSQYWLDKTGDKVIIRQSHGGSGRQATAVINGLAADVVTLALAYDIDSIAQRKKMNLDWQQRLANRSAPYTSTVVFLVRQNNPKNITDWQDLIRKDVGIITSNPKTSGGARWNYLAAWGYALKKYDNQAEQAQEFVKKLYQNVVVMDTGARGATTTFVEREMGDVLLLWESEALMTLEKLSKDDFMIVTPSISILAEPAVAWVDKVVERRTTEELAKAYLEYLYSDAGQQIIVRNFYRPINQQIQLQYLELFPTIELFSISEMFGSWPKVQAEHFATGGIFDQIIQR